MSERECQNKFYSSSSVKSDLVILERKPGEDNLTCRIDDSKRPELNGTFDYFGLAEKVKREYGY